MVYRNNFIVVVKCNNKILREKYDKDHDENVVSLPFNTEYSIEFKNQDSRRVLVSVEIDGVNATKCGCIVVPPNSKVELERFLDNLNSGNRFKFVKKIKEIVEHRGDKIDDGFIRIEYWYEKEKVKIHYDDIWNVKFKEYIPYPVPYPVYPPPIIIKEREYIPYNPNPWYTNPIYTTTSGTITCNLSSSGGAVGSSNGTISASSFMCSSDISNSCSDNSSNYNCYNTNIDDSEGLTVKGSESKQEFHSITDIEIEDQSRVICIKLRGYNEERKEEVKIPIAIDTKITCDKCGKVHKSNKNFCDRCGNYLN